MSKKSELQAASGSILLFYADQAHGPYLYGQVESKYDNGEIPKDARYHYPGLDRWMSVHQVLRKPIFQTIFEAPLIILRIAILTIAVIVYISFVGLKALTGVWRLIFENPPIYPLWALFLRIFSFGIGISLPVLFLQDFLRVCAWVEQVSPSLGGLLLGCIMLLYVLYTLRTLDECLRHSVIAHWLLTFTVSSWLPISRNLENLTKIIETYLWAF